MNQDPTQPTMIMKIDTKNHDRAQDMQNEPGSNSATHEYEDRYQEPGA